jgi:hypothetical protein
MEAFIFSDRQSANCYFRLRKNYPEFCKESRQRELTKASLATRGNGILFKVRREAVGRIARLVYKFLRNECRHSIDKTDIVSGLVQGALDRVNYEEIAHAILLEIKEPS